jgi:hypothetical protein
MTAKPNLFSSLIQGSAALTVALSVLGLSVASAADTINIVFEAPGAASKSIPIDNLALQGGKFTVKVPGEGLPTTPFPESLASHVSGDKPAEIDQAVGLLLLNKPLDALALLEPLLEKHKVSAKVPGNYWIEAARAALVAYSINRSTSKCEEIGKALSDATPAAGDDPQVALSRAMLTSLSVKIDDRISALSVLATDSSPPEVSAYACFFRANLLKTAKRNVEALEAYLTIPSVYPTGGRVINAAAGLNAAEILANMNRRDEAVTLLQDSVREGKNTVIATEAEKKIPLIK